MQCDPQVKAALAQLKSSLGEGADPASSCQPDQSLNKDVMHFLEPKKAVLVMSDNVEMVGIFLISSESAPQKLGLFPRVRSKSMIANGAQHCVSAGRLSRYVLASNLQVQPNAPKRLKPFSRAPIPRSKQNPFSKDHRKLR